MPCPPTQWRLDRPDENQELAAFFAAGGVAAILTDTVPGLACAVDQLGARKRIGAAKGSSDDKPMSVHLRHLDDLKRLMPSPPAGLAHWFENYLPGPFTVLLPTDWLDIPRNWGWQWPSLGVRLPNSMQYLTAAPTWQTPLLATSINTHGDSPLTELEPIEKWLSAFPEIAQALEPWASPTGRASGVLDLSNKPTWLREPETMPRLPGKNILVVCTGNTCRSPLAAALLRQAVAKSWQITSSDLADYGWCIESAGTAAMDGMPISSGSAEVAHEWGIDLSQHAAQSLATALNKPWDLILAMGPHHLCDLDTDTRAELLHPLGQAVADPYGCSVDVYRQCREEMSQAAQQRCAAWRKWSSAE